MPCVTFADDAEAAEVVQVQIREALNGIIGQNGGMLGHFVVIMEVAEITDDDDTDQCTFFAIAERQKVWHSMGLLHYGIAIEESGAEG